MENKNLQGKNKQLKDGVKKITSSDETVTTLLSLAKGIKLVTGIILVLLIILNIY